MNNSEKKTKIYIDTDSFQFAVYEWNPFTKKISQSIADWMKQETIKKEEEAEKPPVKEEKIEEEPSEKVPTEKPTSEELQKVVPFKSLRGSGTRVMSEDHLLKRYDTGVVWDVVLDHIYANVPDEFGREDVIEHVSEYYKTELKRPITPITARNYAANYIRYMRDEDTPYRIEQCDDPNVSSSVVLYKRVKPEKPEEAVKEIGLSDVAVAIYDFAEKSHWIGRKIPLRIEVIEKALPEYTIEEIDEAVTELIRKNKVAQFPNHKVLF